MLYQFTHYACNVVPSDLRAHHDNLCETSRADLCEDGRDNCGVGCDFVVSRKLELERFEVREVLEAYAAINLTRMQMFSDLKRTTVCNGGRWTQCIHR